ncbi:MAG: YIP1 family protein [Deltaproteobacteria bacterium]|nr:YIP1 family protein [Deltaproteobacteria bacterium]
MSDEQEARYKVVFLGPVQNDLATVNKLVQGLKDRFKLSAEGITSMMKMAPVAIKTGATLSEAERYKEILETIGAKVQIEPTSEQPQEETQQTEKSPPPMEAGTPQSEEQQAPAEGPSSLDREPQVIPVRAKTPSPPAETAESSGTKTEAQMITCPQCGCVQEQTDECIKCGVIISKFLKYQEAVKSSGVEPAAPGAAGSSEEGPQVQRIIGTPIDEPEGSTPWEDMASLGFFSALFRTMKEVLFAPTAFFSKMPVSKGLAPPLFYGVIVNFVCGLSAILLLVILFGSMWSFPGGEGVEGMGGGVQRFQTTSIIIFAIFLPILIAIGLFIWSGIYHLCLLIVGAGKRGFEVTFRVVAYTSSAQVFGIMPVVGGFIAFIYYLFLLTIGFRESHRTTTGRALIAVLLPIIVFAFLGIAFAIIIPLFLASQGPMMPEQPPIPGF